MIRSLRSIRAQQVALAVAIWLVALGAGRVEAAFVVDQEQTVHSGSGAATNPTWTSFGQSFKPTLASIQWAEFTLRNQTSSPVVPINLQLAILNGQVGSNGLGGSVLATSPVVILTDTSFTTVHFQLASPLALMPGQQYVLQVNILTANAGVEWEQASTAYSGGQMLQSPYPTNILAGQQYTFSEGILNGDGVVPSDKNTGKCEDMVAGRLKKLFACIVKCRVKQADAALTGKTFDEQACENGSGKPTSCRAAYDKATSALVAKNICPVCLGTATQSDLADLVATFLDDNNGKVYCGGTTPLP